MNNPDPLLLFRQWYLEAVDSGIHDPSIMTLATADAQGKPSARIILLKDFDDRGFVFYTNYLSRKASELKQNPLAALVILWHTLGHQVRIEGRTEKVSAEESDRYFGTRPRGSQLGAWASEQSQTISSKDSLSEAMQQTELVFKHTDVPRPTHWGGYRLIPDRIEFWVEREDRLHERKLYERKGEGWELKLLAP